MKIQCNVCEAAEASVLCCADEAALCWACDEKIHTANKLASKHQRVSLSTSASQIPKCDICQETAGFFFCLEDRALLCRKCDVAIHTSNAYVSAHQRFLLTGVKVGLDPAGPSSSSVNSQSEIKISNSRSKLPLPVEHNGSPLPLPMRQDVLRKSVPLSGGSVAATIHPWNLDDFLGLTEYNLAYSFMDNTSSKADSGKLGDSDCSSIQRTSEGVDECPGEVPKNSWAVPQIPSPPTASGLYWPNTPRRMSEGAVFVPDISSLPENTVLFRRGGSAASKRRQHP